MMFLSGGHAKVKVGVCGSHEQQKGLSVLLLRTHNQCVGCGTLGVGLSSPKSLLIRQY